MDLFLPGPVPKDEGVIALQALLADQVSAKVGPTLTMFLGGVVARGKLPDGEGREVLKRAKLERLEGCLPCTGKICDLLETIANLRPELREAIVQASQQLRQLWAKAEDLPLPPHVNRRCRR